MRLIDADKLLEQFEAWEKLDGEYAQSCSNLAGNKCCELWCVEDAVTNSPTVPQYGYWINVEDQLPGAEQTVIVFSQKTDMFTGKPVYWRSMGFYENGKIKESESFCSWCDMEDYLDDSEDPDDPFIPEGWWEDVNYSEKFSMIDDKVMAWMPLPPLPKKGNAINE